MEEQKPIQTPKKKKGKRYFFNRVMMLCNHVAAIALLTSYLAPFVSPENFWFIAFFGLGYPMLVALNLFFIIYWAIQVKKRSFYSLVILLAGFSNFHRYVQVNFGDAPDKSKRIITVMSYNVKVFDLYDWTRNLETRRKIFSLIRDEAPQIACFQEYFHRDSSKFANTDSLMSMPNFRYNHVHYTTEVKNKQYFGIATFSSYPIVNKGVVNFGYKGNNVCIFSDLVIAKDTFRVYNMHLQSIAFSKEDYKYIDDLQNNVETNEDVEHSRNILKRLKLAFIKRSRQADMIRASIAASPYPVIVCGDFNDTPASYSYGVISEGLEDSFVESGNGFGRSYVGKFPSFRIDYILHSPAFKAYDFRTIREELSDHFPIVCYLQKK